MKSLLHERLQWRVLLETHYFLYPLSRLKKNTANSTQPLREISSRRFIGGDMAFTKEQLLARLQVSVI